MKAKRVCLTLYALAFLLLARVDGHEHRRLLEKADENDLENPNHTTTQHTHGRRNRQDKDDCSMAHCLECVCEDDRKTCINCEEGFILAYDACYKDLPYELTEAGLRSEDGDDQEELSDADQKSMAVALFSAFCLLVFFSVMALILSCYQRGCAATFRAILHPNQVQTPPSDTRLHAWPARSGQNNKPRDVQELRPIVVFNPGSDIAVAIKEPSDTCPEGTPDKS